MRQIVRIRRQQSGFVAIFSVLIIMGILTLLVLGFSSITRQAQKRALDDHLSTQALYAAESGINLVAWDIANGDTVDDITDCDTETPQYQHVIDDDNGVHISCLLVDMSPPDLEFSQVSVAGVGEPIVASVESTGTIASMAFEWDASNCDGPCPIGNRGSSDLVPLGTWGQNVGMLRVDLTSSGAAPSDRNGSAGQTYTFYLYPTTNSSGTTQMTVNSGLGNQGAILLTYCNSANSIYRCRAVINLNGAPSSAYYMRLTSYYNPVSVRVSAYNQNNAAGNVARLQNGQAVIDVTGRANDVFRRLQARVPINASAGYRTGLHGAFSLFSGDSICKRYLSLPGVFSSPGNECEVN